MYQPQFWVLRQNPCANTNQEQMRNFIITQQFITCPFGHISDARNNVLNGRYNETDPEWKSNSQDRKFIENMKIGDKLFTLASNYVPHFSSEDSAMI